MPRTIALAALFAWLVSFGVSTAHSQTGVKDAALQTAIDARQGAIDTRNAAEWSKYTTDDYIQVTAEGAMNSRKVRMDALAAATPTPGNQVTIESVRMFGPDHAITIQRSSGGNRLTLVWVRQGGMWKVASGHASVIAKK